MDVSRDRQNLFLGTYKFTPSYPINGTNNWNILVSFDVF